MSINKAKAFFIIGIIAIAGLSIGIYYYDQFQKTKYDVRIGYISGDLHHLAFFVARNRSMYNASQLNVTAYGFSNGNNIMLNFESPQRSIDIAYLGIVPAMNHKINVKANISILANVNSNGSAIMVKNDGSIQSVADLANKKIAVPTRNNSVQDFILRMVFEQNGITYDPINNIVDMSPANMVLDNFNTVSAFIAWEPYNVKALAGNGKYLMNSSQIWNSHPCCVLASHNDFILEHEDVVRKVLDVHKQATQWIIDNPEEAKQIAMYELNLSYEQATIAIANIGYEYLVNKTLYTEFVQKLLAVNPTVSSSFSSNYPNINASQFVDLIVNAELVEENH